MDNAKCLWFTGLPCSGKTTLAKRLLKHFEKVQLLDGDLIRATPLGTNVGFTPHDRKLHILRMGYIAKMLVDQDIMVLASFVSPNKHVREEVKKMFKKKQFVQVYVNTPIEVCEKRDVKGMYAQARIGKIKSFTGLTAPYEIPNNPDITIDTIQMNIKQSVQYILDQLQE